MLHRSIYKSKIELYAHKLLPFDKKIFGVIEESMSVEFGIN